MPEKTYLITPGPTPVPPEVSAAWPGRCSTTAAPISSCCWSGCWNASSACSRHRRDVLMFAGSGTSAMESAVANLLSPGDRVLVASAGNFGERWAKIVRGYGIEPERHAAGSGASGWTPAAIAAVRRAARLCTSPTPRPRPASSTTCVRSPRRCGRPARCWWWTPSPASAAWSWRPMPGAWTWSSSGSQKALMTPPGLAFASRLGAGWHGPGGRRRRGSRSTGAPPATPRPRPPPRSRRR